MTETFIENVIAQAITALQHNTTGINSRITAINTEKGDFSILSVQDRNIVYGPHKEYGAKDFPLIEVIGKRTEFINEAQLTQDERHYIIFDCYITNQWGDLERMQKALYRYTRCIDEVLRATTWSLPIKQCWIDSHDHEPALNTEDLGYIAYCFVDTIFSSEEA